MPLTGSPGTDRATFILLALTWIFRGMYSSAFVVVQ